MNAIEKLKTTINLVDHVRNVLGENGKLENGSNYRFRSSPEDKTPSLLVYGNQNSYHDYSGRLDGGTIIDFEMKYFNITLEQAIKKLCDQYRISDDEKKEFKKAPKRAELYENFEKYRMKMICAGFIRFLQLRGLSYEFIQNNQGMLNDISKEYGFCENVRIGKDKIYKDVIIFPCYDENYQIIGAKLRTVDGTPFYMKGEDVKSLTVGRSGLIYKQGNISDKYVLIIEGETDYLITKILGYTSVIGNQGGVNSNREKIKDLVKKSDKIICCYDNDGPGIIGTKKLQEEISRPIRTLVYPEIEGMDKYDINDLYKAGYKKEDFDQLIRNSALLDDLHKTNEQPLYNGRFFYNNEQLKYFDTISFSFKAPADLARHLNVKPKELEEMRLTGIIPTYEGVCYWKGGKQGYYNLLNEKVILTPSETPELDENIKFLISNVCNNNKDNIEWLLKTITYKYHNMNDVFIPAVVFHGAGGSGKGLFIKLLEQIFGSENTQIGLTQDMIDSRFSAYSGQKLVVEFKEVSVEDTRKGKKNMNKLKSMIMEDKIQIEKKGQDPIPVENIAWFIMSSNENKPVQLDPSDSGNRRFTIIKTGKFIPKDTEEGICGRTIEQAIRNQDNIKNFLAWLIQKFPNIKSVSALDNQDKKDLEFLSESVGNLFFQRFEEKFPEINKISNAERDFFLEMYRKEISETEYNDDRYLVRYFNAGLSPKYKVGKVFIRESQTRGYIIDKPTSGTGYFLNDVTDVPKRIPTNGLRENKTTHGSND